MADGGIAVHGHLDAQVEDLLYGVGFQPNDLHGFIIKKQFRKVKGNGVTKGQKHALPGGFFSPRRAAFAHTLKSKEAAFLFLPA